AASVEFSASQCKPAPSCSLLPMSPLRYSVAIGVSALLLAGCQTGPPREKGNFRKPDLVEIVKLDATIHLDIRYATTNNFMGRPVYRRARAFLQRPAAEALVRAHQSLKAKGYGLGEFHD